MEYYSSNPDSWKDSVKARLSEKTFTLDEIISIIESMPVNLHDELSWEDYDLHRIKYIDKEELLKKFKK